LKWKTAQEILGPTPDEPYIDMVINQATRKKDNAVLTELVHYE